MVLLDRLLRLVLTGAHKLMRAGWFVRRPRTFGAHALALTPERRIVLVKLRYAPGWRIPGGGRSEREDPRDAVLRELREEIGMTAHGRVRLAAELAEQVDHKKDLASLLIVEEVVYRPRWSLEVERVGEFAIGDLPADTAEPTRRGVELLRRHI